MAKPFAWSYSALTSFENCPLQHYHLRIAKDVKETPGPQLEWGKRVHKAMEMRVLHGDPLPSSMSNFEPLAQAIMAKEGVKQAETKMCLNRNFQPVAYFANDAWVRGVIDVSITAGKSMFIGDWKTGNPKPDSEQLRLFAAMALACNPEIERVTTTFLWLKDGSVTAEKLRREDAVEVWQSFLPRVKRMEKTIIDGSYTPRPSGLCRRHCPVTSCEHNGNHRR